MKDCKQVCDRGHQKHSNSSSKPQVCSWALQIYAQAFLKLCAAQVVELELAKEYALRVKDVAAQEAQAATAATHNQALQAEQRALEELRLEMDASLTACDKQAHQADERHQVLKCSQVPRKLSDGHLKKIVLSDPSFCERKGMEGYD